MGTVFQAANYKQENVPPFFTHLDSIDVAAPDIEETSYVFKNLYENQSELLQGQLHTRFIVDNRLADR